MVNHKKFRYRNFQIQKFILKKSFFWIYPGEFQLDPLEFQLPSNLDSNDIVNHNEEMQLDTKGKYFQENFTLNDAFRDMPSSSRYIYI